MSYKTPPSISLKELCFYISKFERKFLSPTKSLTAFFKKNVIGAWDVDELTASELLTIQENVASKEAACVIVLELKLHPKQNKND